MKLIKLHLLVAAMIIVTSGCVGSGKKYKQQENSAAGVVDSKNKDCYGTYEGILPCADCGGIKTTLTLIPQYYCKLNLLSRGCVKTLTHLF